MRHQAWSRNSLENLAMAAILYQPRAYSKAYSRSESTLEIKHWVRKSNLETSPVLINHNHHTVRSWVVFKISRAGATVEYVYLEAMIMDNDKCPHIIYNESQLPKLCQVLTYATCTSPLIFLYEWKIKWFSFSNKKVYGGHVTVRFVYLQS